MKKVLIRILAFSIALSLLIAFGCAKPAKKALEDNKNLVSPSGKKVSSAEKPEGCASCHVKISEKKDYSLTAMLNKIKDHPPMPVESVADCRNCHVEGDDVFSKGLHRGHYRGKHVFETKNNGSCIHCHKLAKNGEIVIPGLAPKGTKYMTVKSANIDHFPRGCGGCHAKGRYIIMDFNLKKTVNNIPNHPKINFQDFNKCYDCHGKTAPGLEKVLHARHLKNVYYQRIYGNSCLNCHKLNKDGSVKLKGRKK